jgi:long-chain acyl-CoA synthetase
MSADPVLMPFEHLAGRDPAAPLVATPSRSAARGEILDLSRAVTAALTASGAAPGSRVLLACANGAGFLAALAGARRAGLVPVLADVTSPPAERARVAEALTIAVTISCAETFPAGPSAFLIETHGAAGPSEEGGDFIKLTSGSSGAPSGVAVTAEALAADDDQLATSMGLRDDDRFLAAVPWSHSYGLSSLVLPALRRGCLLVLPEDGGPWAPLDAARRLSATVFPTVPIYLQTIASLAERPAWPDSLRLVVSAGAQLRAETAARFLETFRRRAHVFYGASECGGISYDREGSAALRGTVGTPVDGVSIGLPDAASGGEGTVSIRSAAVGLGYVPTGSDRLGDGVFRSADLAAWTAQGELKLLGRADGLINAGGKKVNPSEVEAVLRALPGVRDAVVFGYAAPGSEREIVRAVVACEPGALSHADVTAWCRARLAAHKVPRSIVFLKDVPRNARGKIDRAALAASEPESSRR